MSVKDEMSVVDAILQMPKVLGDVGSMSIAGSISGSSTACAPAMSNQVRIEEVTKADLNCRPAAKASTRELSEIADSIHESKKMFGMDASCTSTPTPSKKTVGFGGRLDSFFENFNALDSMIDGVAGKGGKHGERMKEEWEKAAESLKVFEFYANKALQSLEE